MKWSFVVDIGDALRMDGRGLVVDVAVPVAREFADVIDVAVHYGIVSAAVLDVVAVAQQRPL